MSEMHEVACADVQLQLHCRIRASYCLTNQPFAALSEACQPLPLISVFFIFLPLVEVELAVGPDLHTKLFLLSLCSCRESRTSNCLLQSGVFISSYFGKISTVV